MVNIIEMSC